MTSVRRKTAKEIGDGVTAFKVDVSDLAAVRRRKTPRSKRPARSTSSSTMPGIAGITRRCGNRSREWRKCCACNLDDPHLLQAIVHRWSSRITDASSTSPRSPARSNPNARTIRLRSRPLIALTKSLGKELASWEIAGQRGDPRRGENRDLRSTDAQHIDFMLSEDSRRTFRLVEELAAMVAWLASEDCAFSTGAVFDISRPRHILD